MTMPRFVKVKTEGREVAINPAMIVCFKMIEDEVPPRTEIGKRAGVAFSERADMVLADGSVIPLDHEAWIALNAKLLSF